MYNDIFNKLFRPFLDQNPFLVINSTVKNYTISSYDFTNISNILPNEKILLNNMLLNDCNHFNRIRNELDNQKIKINLTSIYCLLFNECININNEKTQKKLIISALRKYLENILDEISQNLLSTLEDKSSNNTNYNKSQKYKRNKNDLKITIELMFLIIIYMINKYKNIIANTNKSGGGDGSNYIIKGINVKSLKMNKTQEELYFILILQQNLYWIEILLDCLFLIFQKLKNNKYRMLVNADTQFNKLDDTFKLSCFNCFLPLFSLIKQYSTNLSHLDILEYLFDTKNIISNNDDNYNNSISTFLPLKINKIEKVIIKLFECFIYEFLYDIESIWKYFDSLKISINNESFSENNQIMYGFGLFLCNFLKDIAFIRNDNFAKIDFFNFYIFSYNLISNFFSKLNNNMYNLFVGLYDIIKKKYILSSSNINLNYLQSLSNSLKDMLFYFMVFSFYNDNLKDIYLYNEILLNSIISHCFFKVIIPIYFLVVKGTSKNLLIEILQILIDNVNKYKIMLPLKCYFHKEIFIHNFLLILDYYLVNYEKELTSFFKENNNNKELYFEIINLKNTFYETLSCLFDHYNCINFIYSNHIMFMFNKILNNSNIINTSNLDNITLRYIPNDKNFLYYKDIHLNIISYRINTKTNTTTTTIASNETNNNFLKFIEPIKNTNSKNYYDTPNFYGHFSCDYIGYPLESHLDKITSKLITQIPIEGFEEAIINDKIYLLKNHIISKNCNYSTILGNNGEFVEMLGINRNLNENILNIMENIQYTDKFMFNLIEEKIINNEDRNIKVSHSFYNNLKYYDLKFKMDYFEYQEQIKQLLL